MNKVGINIVLLFLCILFPQISFSKTDFLPGYILNLQNDTIRGLIKYEAWDANPEDIGFKQSKMRSTIYYTPKDIAGFSVMNQIFVSAIVQKEMSPFRDSELQKNPVLQLVSDTVFLQTLFGGEKPLYFLKEWDEREQFYIKEDTAYSLLLHKIYIEYVNSIRKEYHNMRFLGQLSRYFWDEPALQEEIADTYYSRSSMEKLFSCYLKLPNVKPVYQNTDTKVSTVYGVLAGVSVTMVIVETDYVKAGFGPSTNFTGGFSVELPMAGKLKNWSFYNELMYSSYNFKSYVGYYFPVNWATFDFKYLRMNNMIRLHPSWFFVNVGISSGYAIQAKSSIFEEARKLEIGFVFGGGIKYKNYSLEVREDIGDGMSTFISIGSETNRFQVLLGYSF